MRSGAGATAARTDTLGIAAHAHADALSVEVRYAGVDILADPGTYCYHGEPAWRSYFRSTIAHNTVELGGRSQSSERGPFMWARHAQALRSRSLTMATSPAGPRSTTATRHLTRRRGIAARCCWTGPRAASTSSMRSRAAATISASSSISAPRCRPSSTGLMRSCAGPRYPHPERRGWNCRPRSRWSLHRGETDPILGWYSPGLGRRVPALTLLGSGRCVPGVPLATRLEFLEAASSPKAAIFRQAVPWSASDARLNRAPEIRAEAR